MKLQMKTKEQEHCIRVPKVFDWVTRFINIKEKEIIEFPRRIFKDCICCNFKVGCNESSPQVIWTALNTSQLSATLTIKLTNSCGCALNIFVNGEKLGTIQEGQSFNATVSPIQTVEVQCFGHEQNENSFCCGEIKIIVHYCDECQPDFKKTRCFLSDSCGNPIKPRSPHAITCKELRDGEQRVSRPFTMPNGNVIALQEVNVMKCGFVTIQFFNAKGKLCKTCTFPFSDVETFFLCAPPGTRLECEITDFECKVFPKKISCECVKVFISINICQSIQIVGDVKIEVKGRICEKREEITPTLDCPQIVLSETCPVLPIEHVST